MDELSTALQIAAKAHAGQKDKAGADYIKHPLAVSEKCRSPRAKIAALLHDVVEDSDVTLDDLRAAGIGGDVIAAVDCLTKRKGEKLDDYLDRVASDDIAIEVKFADMLHNADVLRFPSSFDKNEAEKIFNRYCERMMRLSEKAGTKIRLLSTEAYDEVQRKTNLYLVRTGQRGSDYKPPLEDVKFAVEITASNESRDRAFVFLFEKGTGGIIGYYEIWIDGMYMFIHRVDIRYNLGKEIKEQSLCRGNSIIEVKITTASNAIAADLEARKINVDRFHIAVSEAEKGGWIFTARHAGFL